MEEFGSPDSTPACNAPASTPEGAPCHAARIPPDRILMHCLTIYAILSTKCNVRVHCLPCKQSLLWQLSTPARSCYLRPGGVPAGCRVWRGRGRVPRPGRPAGSSAGGARGADGGSNGRRRHREICVAMQLLAYHCQARPPQFILCIPTPSCDASCVLQVKLQTLDYLIVQYMSFKGQYSWFWGTLVIFLYVLVAC